jgi:hypothetical protein
MSKVYECDITDNCPYGDIAQKCRHYCGMGVEDVDIQSIIEENEDDEGDSEVVLVSNGREVSLEELEMFFIDGYEGGIGYWARINKMMQPEFWEGFKPTSEFTPSEFAFSQLVEGKALKIQDREDGDEFFLTLDALKKVLVEQTYFDWDDYDGDSVDWAFQMAMFGEVVYG